LLLLLLLLLLLRLLLLLLRLLLLLLPKSEGRHRVITARNFWMSSVSSAMSAKRACMDGVPALGVALLLSQRNFFIEELRLLP
jgi:hypothetical protein